MDYERLTEVMRRLALEAGDRIMDFYGAAGVEVRAKDDESPVTAADEAADALIAEGLRAAFPDVPLVTEEQADTHAQEIDTFLIVDPLDGTKEFVKRRGDFTVNIAYVEHGLPVRGVVYAPARKRLFYTTATGRALEETTDDRGAHDPETVGETRRIAVATPDNAALRVVASKSHRDAETDAYIARYEVADTKSAGSSLKFCLLATGEADLYPRLGRTMEWDTAAGHAVLAGAGGAVVRFDDHTQLTYGKPGFANPFFIAYAPGVALVGS
ncbi:3'(2'),5'-bisphosphate nucleotidase CysQ [Rhodosalinus sp.]|uniref:3'(2'),5'-bisphosphate nucleotidase CysQ n=1 Tax=Rhodosalinus sp. TaxID=2047741 RepID=UPI00356537D1